jgi:hypothetical protein
VSAESKDAVSPARGWAGREGARHALCSARRVPELNNGLGAAVKPKARSPSFRSCRAAERGGGRKRRDRYTYEAWAGWELITPEGLTGDAVVALRPAQFDLEVRMSNSIRTNSS